MSNINDKNALENKIEEKLQNTSDIHIVSKNDFIKQENIIINKEPLNKIAEIVPNEMIEKILTDTYRIQFVAVEEFNKDALSKTSGWFNQENILTEDQEVKELIIKIATEKDNKVRRDAESKIKEIKENIDKARLAMQNGDYALAKNYLSTAISPISSNTILKGSALESRIQAVHNEINEIQNG